MANMIYHIQELGKVAAFSCSQLHTILSEVEKVENWKRQCLEIIGRFVDDGNSLLCALQKVLMKYSCLFFVYEIYHIDKIFG